MQNNKFSSLPWFFTHFLAVLLISLALALIRYPFFLNSDYFFSSPNIKYNDKNNIIINKNDYEKIKKNLNENKYNLKIIK